MDRGHLRSVPGEASIRAHSIPGGTASQIPVVPQGYVGPASPRSAVTAQLPVLPAPLRLLQGALLVTIETWDDGSVVASLPCAAVHGSGRSASEALEDLGAALLDFAVAMRAHGAAGLAGPLRFEWEAFCALVDASAVTAP